LGGYRYIFFEKLDATKFGKQIRAIKQRKGLLGEETGPRGHVPQRSSSDVRRPEEEKFAAITVQKYCLLQY
jgi:hypothetical protein